MTPLYLTSNLATTVRSTPVGHILGDYLAVSDTNPLSDTAHNKGLASIPLTQHKTPNGVDIYSLVDPETDIEIMFYGIEKSGRYFLSYVLMGGFGRHTFAGRTPEMVFLEKVNQCLDNNDFTDKPENTGSVFLSKWLIDEIEARKTKK